MSSILTQDTVQFSQAVILTATALMLVACAVSDIRTRRISNRMCLGICGLFILFASFDIVSGKPFMDAVVMPLLAAFGVLMVFGILFSLNMMGGGDVKLLAVMALFAGPAQAFPFILYATFAGGIVALVMMITQKITEQQKLSKQQTTVPYGVAISASGLWVCASRFPVLGL